MRPVVLAVLWVIGTALASVGIGLGEPFLVVLAVALAIASATSLWATWKQQQPRGGDTR